MGGDNNMPYHIIDLIKSDETLATCQMFNAEVCYGSGLQYNTVLSAPLAPSASPSASPSAKGNNDGYHGKN